MTDIATGAATFRLTFGAAVINPVIHIANLDSMTFDFSPSVPSGSLSFYPIHQHRIQNQRFCRAYKKQLAQRPPYGPKGDKKGAARGLSLRRMFTIKVRGRAVAQRTIPEGYSHDHAFGVDVPQERQPMEKPEGASL